MADTGKEGERGSQAHSLFLSFLFTYTHTFCSGASFGLCRARTHRDDERERERKRQRKGGGKKAATRRSRKKRHKEANGSRDIESQTLTFEVV